MNKSGFFLFQITVILIAVVFFYTYYLFVGRTFTCVADVNFIVNKNNEIIKLDSDYDFVLEPNRKASIHINGTLTFNDRNYDLNRAYFMEYSRKNNSFYYEMHIVNKSKHKLDNTPDELFEAYFMAQNLSAPFYLKVSKIRNNLYLTEGLKRTYFTCLRT
ncbi:MULTISPECIES: FidL-like protein [Enterobacter]|uniref:FidL-like protein n=1 Tax=Enterobacter TaxID=547 RepID=UPI001CBDCC8E|nr:MULTISPECIES: FidL-like protein [Enterobacter]UAN38685.1 hypothetical protein KGP18_22690 [Enterobacter asburiae]UAN43455.1 hypothetical protein KGP24_24445 [Enterobacter sp. JBIWA008]UXP26356.1 FidL-like protein [Enterobacter sp. 155105]